MLESEVSIASPHVNLLCELVFCRSGYFHSVLSDAETEFMFNSIQFNLFAIKQQVHTAFKRH